MQRFILILSFFLFHVGIGFSQEKTFSESALSDVLLDIDGIEVSFDSILKKNEGSVVLLDIWASWCRDCIVGMPTVKELSETYPDVSFIYISLDKTEAAWKRGIKKYKLEGKMHYWAAKGWKSPLFSSMDLDWIPRYMVLDEKGKIKLFRAIKANDENITQQLE